MPDVLIRNFPAADLARIDEHAARHGISRAEYLRRRLQQDARRSAQPVTPSDLAELSRNVQDLGDNDVMSDAWS